MDFSFFFTFLEVDKAPDASEFEENDGRIDSSKFEQNDGKIDTRDDIRLLIIRIICWIISKFWIRIIFLDIRISMDNKKIGIFVNRLQNLMKSYDF